MHALKWIGIGLGGLFVLMLLLPAGPGGSQRRVSGGEMEAVGMLMGGMLACGVDTHWVATTRIRLRDQDPSLFAAHFEPAYAAGLKLGGTASPETCADMLRRGRNTVDRAVGP